MVLSDFVVGDELGSGSYATVYRAVRKADGKAYALKRVTLRMSSAFLRSMLNEVRLLCSFRHGRLLRCFEAFISPDNRYLYVVMELCQHGDLNNKIKRYRKRGQYIDEMVIWVYFLEICEGLKALHDRDIIHRDIKANNIFIAGDGSVKIGDFNVSKVMHDSLAETVVGTPYYMAPEVWKSEPYGTAADMWSLGCLIYELCCLRHTFPAKDARSLKAAVLSGEYTPIPDVYTAELRQVVGSLLQLDPAARPTARDLLFSESFRSRMAFVKSPLNEAVGQPPVVLLSTLIDPDDDSAAEHLADLLPPPDYTPMAGASTHRRRRSKSESSGMDFDSDRASLQPPGISVGTSGSHRPRHRQSSSSETLSVSTSLRGHGGQASDGQEDDDQEATRQRHVLLPEIRRDRLSDAGSPKGSRLRLTRDGMTSPTGPASARGALPQPSSSPSLSSLSPPSVTDASPRHHSARSPSSLDDGLTPYNVAPINRSPVLPSPSPSPRGGPSSGSSKANKGASSPVQLQHLDDGPVTSALRQMGRWLGLPVLPPSATPTPEPGGPEQAALPALRSARSSRSSRGSRHSLSSKGSFIDEMQIVAGLHQHSRQLSGEDEDGGGHQHSHA